MTVLRLLYPRTYLFFVFSKVVFAMEETIEPKAKPEVTTDQSNSTRRSKKTGSDGSRGECKLFCEI